MVVIMRPLYTVAAVRTGRWWALEVPALRGVHSQARRLDQADAKIRDAIAMMLDVSEDSFDVAIEPQLESLGDLGDAVAAALRARQAAEEAQQASSNATRQAVRTIRDSGYTARDAGILLGVSDQRISQIERSARTQADSDS
jgi:predicted RNase H-like HicB family nuclease